MLDKESAAALRDALEKEIKQKQNEDRRNLVVEMKHFKIMIFFRGSKF